MKKIIGIYLSILVTLAILALIIIIVIDACVYDWSLKLSDWLSVVCTGLSLIGTISLAVITVFQTDVANKQNKELQKINDKQFKIANQRFYPLLKVNNVTFFPGKIVAMPNLGFWEKSITNLMDENNRGAFINIDARANKDTTNAVCSKIKFSICNVSDAIINEVKIYKYSAGSPINDIIETEWPIDVFILNNGESCSLEICFYHNNESILNNHNAINFNLFMRINTITKVSFYEKVNFFATDIYSYGVVEQLSENLIK